MITSALNLGFLSSKGDQAEALGGVIGFAVGFGIMMIVAIVLAIKITKKRKNK